jgi:hypothetical protein
MTENIFNDWLDQIIKTEKPNADIQAYYFGILETEDGYETYLVGSEEFDEEDDDWACNMDFVPENKYLTLGQNEVDWELILADVKKYIENYIQTPNFKNSFLEKAKAIATGFDGGDLYRIK